MIRFEDEKRVKNPWREKKEFLKKIIALTPRKSELLFLLLDIIIGFNFRRFAGFDLYSFECIELSSKRRSTYTHKTTMLCYYRRLLIKNNNNHTKVISLWTGKLQYRWAHTHIHINLNFGQPTNLIKKMIYELLCCCCCFCCYWNIFVLCLFDFQPTDAIITEANFNWIGETIGRCW